MPNKKVKKKGHTKKAAKKQGPQNSLNKYYFGSLKKVKIPTLSVYASPITI